MAPLLPRSHVNLDYVPFPALEGVGQGYRGGLLAFASQESPVAWELALRATNLRSFEEASWSDWWSLTKPLS